jgi:hypothetical protein
MVIIHICYLDESGTDSFLKASQAGYHYYGPLRKGEQKLKLSI